MLKLNKKNKLKPDYWVRLNSDKNNQKISKSLHNLEQIGSNLMFKNGLIIWQLESYTNKKIAYLRPNYKIQNYKVRLLVN